ncbi:MAG TPA: hypothetical protein VFB32_04515 [Rudaea sp.]|nr:hypothetical protein [Rudaea sp.]
MRRIHRYASLALCATLLAACGKHEEAGLPLSYVPADTPYVYANVDPLPKAVIDQWSQRMQQYWPTLFGMYEEMLKNAPANADPQKARFVKIARVLVDELKTRNTWAKLNEIGLKSDGHAAIYGVGMVPVARLELSDPNAFRAEIARIEDKLGEKLTVAKTGAQEYWQFGDEDVSIAVAIEGTHLVVTLIPRGAADDLKQTLLGVTRPAQNLAGAGTLDALAKQYGYTPYGSGYVDFVRITERLTSAPTGSDAAFAKAIDLPTNATDATCRSEALEIAHKFPRLVAGVEELSPQRMRVGVQLDIEQSLAMQLVGALGAAPGSAQPGSGLLDLAISVPVLKLKDFWLKQADAVAAKPYACAALASVNDEYRDSKAKIDVTVPPPFSDLTGFRVTLDKLDAGGGGMPDVEGKLLMGSTNPAAALAMAELSMPPLKSLKLVPDGKAVPLPAGAAPPGTPPLFAAMSDKAIALAAGVGEDATLGDYLKAPAASDAVFMRMYFSGKFYATLGQWFGKMKAALPPDKQAQLDQQAKLFALYEQWIRSAEIRLVATASGISLHEIVEQN